MQPHQIYKLKPNRPQNARKATLPNNATEKPVILKPKAT